MITFICKDCANKQHTKCREGTWCDCQHRRSPEPARDFGDDE